MNRQNEHPEAEYLKPVGRLKQKERTERSYAATQQGPAKNEGRGELGELSPPSFHGFLLTGVYWRGAPDWSTDALSRKPSAA